MDKMEIYFGQVDEAISVMREVAAWGRSRGFRVWPDEWLTREELITPDARPEDFCIGKVDGETACAFILQRRDREYWARAAEGEAVYLHKFCVKREFGGRNMTETAVEAIKKHCGERGIRYIRLDTALDEAAVKRIYLAAGFRIVDVIGCPNGRSMALYELEV